MRMVRRSRGRRWERCGARVEPKRWRATKWTDLVKKIKDGMVVVTNFSLLRAVLGEHAVTLARVRASQHTSYSTELWGRAARLGDQALGWRT